MHLDLDHIKSNFNIPTILQANKLQRDNKGKYFEALLNVIRLITNINEEDEKHLSIQEAIYLSAFFRSIHWSDIPIYTHEEHKVMASDILSSDANMDRDYFLLDNEKFMVNIPILEAIKAEQQAFKIGFGEFPDMILGAGHEKGFEFGWRIISKLKATPVGVGNYDSYVQGVSEFSPIYLKLNSNDDSPITCVQLNKKPFMEFPFRPSLLFTLR